MIVDSWPARPDPEALVACIRWERQQISRRVSTDTIQPVDNVAIAWDPAQRGVAIARLAGACKESERGVLDERMEDVKAEMADIPRRASFYDNPRMSMSSAMLVDLTLVDRDD